MDASNKRQREEHDVEMGDLQQSPSPLVKYSSLIPSRQLALFMPLVLVAESEQIAQQMTMEFTGKVVFPPINGEYGNFTHSIEGQRYVFHVPNGVHWLGETPS
jgi:hypothetical protein